MMFPETSSDHRPLVDGPLKGDVSASISSSWKHNAMDGITPSTRFISSFGCLDFKDFKVHFKKKRLVILGIIYPAVSLLCQKPQKL
jgi:hypothetical protein